MIGKFDGDNGEIRNLAGIPWRQYLQEKDYNKDINKMCDLCIKEQVKKYGTRTIKCSGLLSADEMVPAQYSHMFSQEERDLMEEAINPYYWAAKNIDIDNDNPSTKIFIPRWYQEQYTRCSAPRKTIRAGRRAGKTEGIVIALLHKLLTNEKYNVLVVTPYDSQAEEIYSKAKRILNNLTTPYEELVESARESPNYQIKFKNGSKLKAFTAGNSGAAQVRGQPANLIYIDETDLLGQKDFNSILAILLDKADTEFWVSSTPDGEKQMYRLSQDKSYKEFHFPSFVLPHYTDDLDNDMRGQSDEMGYVQEVMAEFGASRAGVFQKYYVDKCSNIEFSETPEGILTNRGNFIVTMGCDWNHEGIGTRIVALAYDKTEQLFFIAEKATVSKEGWTQTAAMEKIIELNRKYRFDKIYVDRGFGYTQIETLKSFAMSQFGKLAVGHPDLFLAEIVGVDFGSKIEVKDPYTGTDIKKDMKPYMVETLNRIIEKLAIKFDKLLDKPILDQLKGYQEKRSISGRPTYSASSAVIGDHDLDALMLASLAYNIEYSEIFANMRSTLAIRILSSEEVYGKNMTHLNPKSSNKNIDYGLDIHTKKRENCAPGNRTGYATTKASMPQERGTPGEIRVSTSSIFAGHTVMSGRNRQHTRAAFK
jgi:replicative DNA helicase